MTRLTVRGELGRGDVAAQHHVMHDAQPGVGERGHVVTALQVAAGLALMVGVEWVAVKVLELLAAFGTWVGGLGV